MDNDLLPARIIPPGLTIAAELRARAWTQRDLANRMERDVRAVRAIIHGERPITNLDALGLASAFGTSVDFWTNLEYAYRRHLAQRRERDAG